MTVTAARNDPFLTFRFEIRLDDLPAGGFSDCAGLQSEVEMQDYAEGGLNTFMHKFPGRAKQSTLTLKRGIVDRVLWDWHYALSRGRVRRRNGSIAVRDASGANVVMEWQFRGALPAKWTGPELNASQSAVAVETLELAHQGLERIK
jgi:phage tail-like protein